MNISQIHGQELKVHRWYLTRQQKQNLLNDTPYERNSIRTYWLLPDDELLHLLNLRDVVFVGLQLLLMNTLVNANQHVPRDVFTIIHSW